MVHYLSFRSLMYQHWCQISSNIFLTCFALARLIILTAVDLASISCNITTCFACGIGSRWHSASSLRGFFLGLWWFLFHSWISELKFQWLHFFPETESGFFVFLYYPFLDVHHDLLFWRCFPIIDLVMNPFKVWCLSLGSSQFAFVLQMIAMLILFQTIHISTVQTQFVTRIPFRNFFNEFYISNKFLVLFSCEVISNILMRQFFLV